jgi:O-antigen ligase
LFNLRWVVLVGLAGVGLHEIWKYGGRTPVPLPIVCLAFFTMVAFASVTYSLIPRLSMYRAISFSLALLGLVYGIGLLFSTRPNEWLRLLAYLNVGLLVLTVLRLPFADSFDTGLLEGPFSNPNSLGSALALTFPALLWLREHRPRGAVRPTIWLVLTGAVAANVIAILATRSRASISVLACVLLLYAVLRRSRLAGMFALVALVVVLAAPSLASQFARDAALKGRDSQVLAFAQRQGQLEATIIAAEARPLYGFGFGTSMGETQWSGSLSSTNSGREKANAYIAAVEEVGLLGAVPLVLAVAVSIAGGWGQAWRARMTHNGAPAALFTITATAALHTNFEAWLTSVGAFEAFIFWSTIGVMLMSTAVKRQHSDTSI